MLSLVPENPLEEEKKEESIVMQAQPEPQQQMQA